MSILALCPSRGRPDAARETLASFLATRKGKDSRIVFVVDRDDPTLRQYPKEHTHVVRPTGCMGDALRQVGAEVYGDATSVGMIGDDNRFESKGWDVVLDAALTERIGVAYGDDGFQHERLPTAWWVSRPLVDVFGIAPKGLKHLYMDNWWKSLAEGAGCLRYFPDVSIPHLHPHITDGPNWINSARADETYKRGNSAANARNDRNYFDQWTRRYRRDDVRTARRIIGGGIDKRRVLADWHHPALWESLSILFEDRFGWELYSMGGSEWTKHGWKMSSGPPIGWTMDDYLRLGKPVGDHYEQVAREYPARPRKQVTPEQAAGMSWDFVLGSVPDHQRSFAVLAKSFGARFIHQVGNARHPVDQSLNQVVLASSVVHLRRTPHVVYHQEFDRTLFAPTPIVAPNVVTSLMLRLDWTSCEYKWLAGADGICWNAPGGKDPNAETYLAPMSKVADAIAGSGWVWMDKRIGDGYGHTIHNAAAMGRPLIGHGRHYKGLMGEPFWRDLETCVDLDKHTTTEALRLIRAISNDPDWHAEMGANIQAVFDELVDFDAEAERIRSALT